MTRLFPVPPDSRVHVEYARTGSIERHPLERRPIVTAGLAKQVLRGRGAFDVVGDLGADELQGQSEHAECRSKLDDRPVQNPSGTRQRSSRPPSHRGTRELVPGHAQEYEALVRALRLH
jgi:hypothetical protein